MTDISQVVNVVVNVGDVQVTAAGFGTPLIMDDILAAVFSERVRSYNSIADVAVDFPNTTKVWKAANAIFSQARAPNTIKVGRKAVGDANESAALAAILAEDSDWYCLIAPYKTSAVIQALAADIAPLRKIYLASSENADVLDAVATDVASLLQAASNNRAAYMWHHEAGVDLTGVNVTILAEVATAVSTAHGLRVGDPITGAGNAQSQANGNKTVSTVPDPNTFTYDATGAADDAVADVMTFFARYSFPEAAWAGAQLSSDPGSETWKFKQLTGIKTSPRTLLSSAQELRALGKNANLYTDLAGVGHTQEGVMTGGRFIDIQRGIDWTTASIETAIANLLLNSGKVPYTDAGGTILHAEIAKVMDTGITRGLFGPLLDDSGNFYVITVPKVAAQLPADRTARTFKGITVQAQLAGAVHSLAITVNAQI